MFTSSSIIKQFSYHILPYSHMRKSVKKEMILRNNFRLQSKVLFSDNHFNRLNKKRFTATDFILLLKDFKNNQYVLWRLS